MTSVDISVVIPCFNVSTYIGECLQSVVEQSRMPVDIICVDDHSTDNTNEVIESFVQRYPSLITLIPNKQKKGAPGSRNTGLAVSKGNYIQFLDADDIIFKEKFSHQSKIIQDSQCKTDILVGSFSKKYLDGSERIYRNEDIDAWIALIDNKMGVTSANLFKRSKLEEISGWELDMKSSQEYDLMFRLMKKDAVVQFDQVLLNLNRERVTGSITKTNPREKWKRYIDLRILIFKYLQSTKQLTPKREQTFATNLLNAARSLYKYDREASIFYYKQYLKGRRLPFNELPINPIYVLLYNLFGFKAAQEISIYINRGRSRET
jgi:glycosyltransferase involved in cell wall biosynthesis